MNHRVRSQAFAVLATVAGVGGWLATLWAASDRWAGIAFTAIVLLLIVAAFRGRFASVERARDFWACFALFGLVHLLAARPNGLNEPMTCVGIDRLGDRLLGVVPDDMIHRPVLTPLGRSLDTILVDLGEYSATGFLPYVRATTKLFTSLAFAALGGLLAVHLRRRSVLGVSLPRPGGCPLLGIAWLYLLAGLIGATFAIHASPDLFHDGGWFPKCPGSAMALFVLYNVEFVAVLFAALEARFAAERERPWWLGFALLGGAYLVVNRSTLAPILPTHWADDLFQWTYHRFVSESQMPAVTVRGWILFDYASGEFYQSGSLWSGQAAFLPVAWLGTVAARLAFRIGARTAPGWLARWRVRSSIGRLMLAMVGIGLILAAARDPSERWVATEANAMAALLLFAALRASFGPESSRAWWWGFALVGGVDLLVGATRNGWGQFIESPSPWPIHEAAHKLHRLAFERYTGKSVPSPFASYDVGDPMLDLLANYRSSQSLVLMALSLPMAWIGATLARWIDRRRGGTVERPGELS